MVRFILLFTIAASTLYSCQEPVDLYLEEGERKIVAHGYLSPGVQAEINLELSFPYNSGDGGDTEEITNAVVKLNDQYGHTQEFSYNDSIRSYLPVNYMNILPGDVYDLKVKVPGYDSVFDRTRIPSKIKIDSIRHYPVTVDYRELERYEITFSDPPNEENFYFFYTIGGSYNHFYSDDPLLQWDFVEKDYIVFSDEIIDGQKYTIVIDYFFNSEDSVSIHLQSLSPEAYFYFQSIDAQHNIHEFPIENVELNIPIAQPFQIFTNLENAVGIFASFNSDVKTLPAPE